VRPNVSRLKNSLGISGDIDDDITIDCILCFICIVCMEHARRQRERDSHD
jgi:hypothetical protein